MVNFHSRTLPVIDIQRHCGYIHEHVTQTVNTEPVDILMEMYIMSYWYKNRCFYMAA